MDKIETTWNELLGEADPSAPTQRIYRLLGSTAVGVRASVLRRLCVTSLQLVSATAQLVSALVCDVAPVSVGYTSVGVGLTWSPITTTVLNSQ